MAEQNTINIFIPTYKRSHDLVGMDYFPTAKYVVPESQLNEYKNVLSEDRIVVIPDEFDGNLCKKQNWMLRNLERPYLKMDDDVDCIMMTEGMHDTGKGHDKATEKIRLTPEQAMNVIVGGFNLAKELGCVYWGININTDGRNYQQYKPFSLTKPVLGPFHGHLEHDLFYDERMGGKDDYDFSLQVLRKYKKILRIDKYAYDCEHGDNKGGFVSMRTMDKEIEDCRMIEKKWGRHIISYTLKPVKMTDLLNGKVRVPIKGV